MKKAQYFSYLDRVAKHDYSSERDPCVIIHDLICFAIRDEEVSRSDFLELCRRASSMYASFLMGDSVV